MLRQFAYALYVTSVLGGAFSLELHARIISEEQALLSSQIRASNRLNDTKGSVTPLDNQSQTSAVLPLLMQIEQIQSCEPTKANRKLLSKLKKRISKVQKKELKAARKRKKAELKAQRKRKKSRRKHRKKRHSSSQNHSIAPPPLPSITAAPITCEQTAAPVVRPLARPAPVSLFVPEEIAPSSVMQPVEPQRNPTADPITLKIVREIADALSSPEIILVSFQDMLDKFSHDERRHEEQQWPMIIKEYFSQIIGREVASLNAPLMLDCSDFTHWGFQAFKDDMEKIHLADDVQFIPPQNVDVGGCSIQEAPSSSDDSSSLVLQPFERGSSFMHSIQAILESPSSECSHETEELDSSGDSGLGHLFIEEFGRGFFDFGKGPSEALDISVDLSDLSMSPIPASSPTREDAPPIDWAQWIS